MKKLMYAIFAIGFLTRSVSLAQADVVRTPLWQIPNVKEVKFRVEALDPKLTKICSEYRDLVVSEPGQEVFDREDIERLRGETPSVLDRVFTTKFRISLGETPEINKAAVEEANTKVEALKSKDLLPYYTLRLGELASQFQPNSAVVVYWKPKSLSAISNSVGLKPLAVSVLPGSVSSTIVVKGKDTACDLLAGEGWLEFDARTRLNPHPEDLQSLEKFYVEMADIVNQSFNKKKTAVGRASIFGYKMESLLRSHRTEGNKAEDVLGYYVDSFFDSEMLPNQIWQKRESNWKVLVPQEVYSSIKVIIRR